jgi:hypothetical protein
MSEIGKALGDRFLYNLSELRYVLQSLHRHRREKWQIDQDEQKAKYDRKRKGTNARRHDVIIVIFFFYKNIVTTDIHTDFFF